MRFEGDDEQELNPDFDVNETLHGVRRAAAPEVVVDRGPSEGDLMNALDL